MTIDKSITELKKEDIGSLILFSLFKLREVPEYASLSELAYLLDSESLVNFLRYYGGMTIKVPTLRELRLIISALIMYQYINIEGKKYKEAVSLIDAGDYTKDEIKDAYSKICEVVGNYDFNREQ